MHRLPRSRQERFRYLPQMRGARPLQFEVFFFGAPAGGRNYLAPTGARVMNDHAYRTQEYDSYIRSKEWKDRRCKFLACADYCCQRCKQRHMDGTMIIGWPLEVHHLHYNTFGNEGDDDCVVLCVPCHRTLDEERRLEVAAAGERSLWDARVDGWASKKYGDDWDSYVDAVVVEEEFQEWLETVGDA